MTEYYLETGAKVLKANGVEVPHPLTWLEGEVREHYIEDVKVVQEFAALNRKVILEEIMKGMKWKAAEQFSSVHNYIESVQLGQQEELILRKGAISAKEKEQVIIPVNMRDGVILGLGKGNAEWNQSAPHGSGRALRRDEAPFAYRSMEQLIRNISDTVEVTHVLKPVYNFKAGKKA